MADRVADHRRAWLAVDDRLRALSPADRELVRLVSQPGFRRWREQVRAVGGCSRPIHLAGRTTVVDRASGVVVRSYDSAVEPGGRVLVRCNNRRESACPACSFVHRGDTYQVVRAGLSGGKGVPGSVAGNPRLFVTLTAPGFGAVHRAGGDGGVRCRPRRDAGVCDHGRPVGCSVVHADDDPVVGQPVCPDCYDYCGHVLWHAHVGRLWSRWTDAVRRRLASAGGIPRSKLGAHLVVSFAKVAEYQRRGAVHFHAVVRLDGPEGPGSAPPAWAADEVLEAAVREAAGAVQVVTPYAPEVGEYVIRWGAQLDVRPIRAGLDEGLTDDAVAAYVAKYVSKSVTGGSDHRITSAAQIRFASTPHIRALMAACWRLGGIPEFSHLRLRAWAHALGFRGHVLTKSRRYSITYGVLRSERASWKSGTECGPGTGTEVISSWRFAGSGYPPGGAAVTRWVAREAAERRAILREVRESGSPGGG